MEDLGLHIYVQGVVHLIRSAGPSASTHSLHTCAWLLYRVRRSGGRAITQARMHAAAQMTDIVVVSSTALLTANKREKMGSIVTGNPRISIRASCLPGLRAPSKVSHSHAAGEQ